MGENADALLIPYVEIPIESITFIHVVGAGRFGSVYQAKWNGHDVAVKKTLCFENEARLLASLSHKNIIRFYGACTKAPNSFLVTEYAEYGSLFSFLESLSHIEFPRLLMWARDVAEGMRYLHHDAPVMVTHHDLKSLNVLVCQTNEGELTMKICDFGSSRAGGRDSKTITTAGTVAWMAPEVIRNERVSNKCDVWSYGVILWELLTLQVPYGEMESFAVMWLVAKQGMKLHIPEHTPSAFKTLIMMCMHTNPKSRPNFIEILKCLDQMMCDTDLPDAMVAFYMEKEQWQAEIEKILEQYAQLEHDHIVLAEKTAALDERERALRRREEALQHHLHSQSIARKVTVPDSPSAHYSRSPFSKISSSSSSYNATAGMHTSAAALTSAKMWNEEEVASWVSVLPDGLNKYASIFLANNTDGKLLFNLTQDVLKEEYGIKSFGHRTKILEHISNLQLSSDFPPLVARKSPGAGSSGGSAGQATKLETAVVFVFTHDKTIHHWTVSVQAKDDLDIISSVDFTLAKEGARENENIVVHQYPFEHIAACDPHCTTLSVAVKYKTKHFQRKTTKKNIELKCGDCVDSREEVPVKLIPKESSNFRFDTVTLKRFARGSIPLRTESSSETEGFSQQPSSTSTSSNQ